MSAATLSARRRLAFIVLALGALLASAVLAYERGPLGPSPASAGGATIVVNTLDDEDPILENGDCSLREAIVNANDSAQTHADCASGAGADTITFDVSGTIELVNDLPPITNPAGLTIDGGGVVTVSGMDAHRPFGVAPGATLALENLTVTNGSAPHGGGIYSEGVLALNNGRVINNQASGTGGGIHNHNGDVTLTASAVDGNHAGDIGGGIYVRDGSVTLRGSTVSDNTADSGAGIYNIDGTVDVSDSSVSDNTAVSGSGGGIETDIDGEVSLTRSTVSGNSAATFGGGIYDNGGTLVVANSTVSGNEAGGDGGGILNHAGLIVTNATITANAAAGAGGGVFNEPGGQFTLRNSIIVDQETGDDCAGDAPISAGHNLDSDGTCGLTEDGDIPEGDANVGPLADNGGPTLTHALLQGSDAIDAGDDAVCAAPPVNGVDQRGGLRPAGKACDIGAFEFGGVIPLWGDIDCDGSVVIGDALKTARYLLGLSVSQEPGCPEPGADITADGEPRVWGDVDCDESVAIGDALKIARWLLGLSVSQEEGCPEIGTDVFIAS
jgi:CSLREA domain-containing protein